MFPAPKRPRAGQVGAELLAETVHHYVATDGGRDVRPWEPPPLRSRQERPPQRNVVGDARRSAGGTFGCTVYRNIFHIAQCAYALWDWTRA